MRKLRLNINKYLSQLEATINSFPIIASYNLNIDRKTDEIVFLTGKIDFKDSSTLDFKEFIESTEKGIEKYKYAYNYRKGSHHLFRYDNAPDPRAKKLKTFPDHKHLKNGNIIDSRSIALSDVLDEIEGIYLLEED